METAMQECDFVTQFYEAVAWCYINGHVIIWSNRYCSADNPDTEEDELKLSAMHRKQFLDKNFKQFGNQM